MSARIIHLRQTETYTEGRTRWVYAVPCGVVEHPDGTIDLSDVEQVRAALEAQFGAEGFLPSVLVEHERQGGSVGSVTGFRILSQAEAAEHGIKQRDAHAVWLSTDLQPDAARAYDTGRVRYTSPEIRIGWTDDSGRVWPLFIGELSFVAVPHVKRQPPIDTYREVSLADTEGKMDDEKTAAILGILAEIKDMLAAQAAPMADAPADEAGTMAAELADTKRQLAELRAVEGVRTDLAAKGRTLSDALIRSLADVQVKAGLDAYAALLDALPSTTPAPSARLADVPPTQAQKRPKTLEQQEADAAAARQRQQQNPGLGFLAALREVM